MSHLSTNQIEQLFENCMSTGSSHSLRYYMLHDSNAKSIVLYINNCISTSRNGEKGFEYICRILPFCSSDILNENAVIWATQSLSFGQKFNAVNTTIKVVGTLIPLCVNNPNFNKSMASNLLPKVIEACTLNSSHQLQANYSLKCIELCLKHYGSTCGPFRNKIEKFLLKFIDLRCPPSLQTKVGRCLHYLQQAGGAGSEKLNHIHNWSLQVKKLSKSLHLLYDQFFEGITEFDEYSSLTVDPVDFPKIVTSSSKYDSIVTLSRRMCNIVLYLRAFLETGYPVIKSVPVQLILDLIKRGLSVHQCASGTSADRSNFSVTLMNHQQELLLLLQSLISTNFQRTFYKVFRCWIGISKSNINTTFHEKLISTLITHIQPSKEEITLNLNLNISQQKSAKGKKKLRDQIISDNTSSNTSINCVPGISKTNEQVTMYAIETLCSVLENVTLNIQKKTRLNLYHIVFKTLFQIQEGRANHPYTDSKCQQGMYLILLALIKQPEVETSPLLKTCLNIFTNGLNNSSRMITDICYKGIEALESTCQPTCLSLDVSLFTAIHENGMPEEANFNKNKTWNDIPILNSPQSLDQASSDFQCPNKINILEVQVLQSSKTLINANDINGNEPVILTSDLEDDDAMLIQDMTKSSNIIEPKSSESLVCKENVVIVNDTNDVLTLNDDNVHKRGYELKAVPDQLRPNVRPTKKPKLENNDWDEYDDMLASFVDSVDERTKQV